MAELGLAQPQLVFKCITAENGDSSIWKFKFEFFTWVIIFSKMSAAILENAIPMSTVVWLTEILRGLGIVSYKLFKLPLGLKILDLSATLAIR